MRSIGSSLRQTLAGGMALGLACAGAGAAAPAAGGVKAGDRYVALGSSYAAGPGITPSADTPPNRCARSQRNYAHLLAARRRLTLVDVSCSSATTAAVLGPWQELPPQIDAVAADTKLVTVTVGGNDVGYVGGLMSAGCYATVANATAGSACRAVAPATEADWTKLDASMRAIAAQVRRRAPAARLVFLDYPTILPANGTCAATPLTAAQAEQARVTGARLSALTAKVARETKADFVPSSRRSEGHDACAATAWMNGFPKPGGPQFMPYHPNAVGMAAEADALDALLAG